MWLLILIHLLFKIKGTFSDVTALKHEPEVLIELFHENLKVDPLLVYDLDLSFESKHFIDRKIEIFTDLLSGRPNSLVSRAKRSLKESKTGKLSIDVFPQTLIPTQYADDIRLFQNENTWFAASLEDKKQLVLYKYSDSTFIRIFEYTIAYSTNLAVLSTADLPLIVTADCEILHIFQLNQNKSKLNSVLNIKLHNAIHVALWDQNHVPYLSVITKDQSKTNVTVYKWKGKHFDHVQDVELYNIKKVVPFSIHGSHFLATVNEGKQEGSLKSYSDILKFNPHLKEFVVSQPLLTNVCGDIKFFTAVLHGELHYFLIVVRSARRDNQEFTSDIYKYEDQYFIPFQSVTSDAVEWQPIQDSKGNAALLALSPGGLQGFQYDGWQFIRSDMSSNENFTSLRFEELKTLHTYDFEENQVLVVACAHCKNVTNVYAVNFTNFDKIQDTHASLLTWCMDALENPDGDDPSGFVAEALRGDLSESVVSFEEDRERQLAAALSESSNLLHIIEESFNVTSFTNNPHIFNNVQFETIIFNNKSTLNSLKVPRINNLNIDTLMENVLDIEDDFELRTPVDFQILTVEYDIELQKLNDHNINEYIMINKDVDLERLIVTGSASLSKGIHVRNSINNISVSYDTLLLRNANQTFKRNLKLDAITSEELTTKLVNRRLIQNEEISHIENLEVNNLIVKGYLNGVSIPVLDRRALKKMGDQVLEQPLYVEVLNVAELNTNGTVAGTNISDNFVLINSGEYVVDQDVEFKEALHINELQVLNSLNNISVTNDGGLDVLLSEASFVQRINARKTFENLTVASPILLRNKINNPKMQRFNPVIIDTNTYDVPNDLTINGKVNVTRWLKVNDLKSVDGVKSLGEVIDNGVKLSDAEIPVHITFTQPLDLDDVIADKVNSFNPHDWLLEASNSSQIVRGHKRFLGNIHLKGATNVFEINNIDVQLLEKEVLRVEGDQMIDGIWTINEMEVKKGVTFNRTNVQNLSTNDVLIIDGDLEVYNLTATNMEVKGLLNERNISEELKNVAKRGTTFQIFGQKRFKELKVKNLQVTSGNAELLNLMHDVSIDRVTMDQNMDIFNEINIDSIQFHQKLNGVSMEELDLLAALIDADNTTVSVSGMQYNSIVVLGDVFVETNSINGRNLTDIEKNTVKIDENHEFERGEFGEVVSVEKTLDLTGNIENLDLDTIVEQRGKDFMEIRDKTFSSPMLIDGILQINDTVSGLDLNKLCTFSQPSNRLKTLQIIGDVVFVKGPKISNINNMNVGHLKNNLWFVDRFANISGRVYLRNRTIFNDSVEIKEYVDGIKLSVMMKNYLSKSKNQIVPATLTFDEVAFSNISVPLLTFKGPINGIVPEDLLKTILIQEEAQVFEGPAYFEELHVDHLNEDAEYTVNGFNLKSDVMRYNAENVVTSLKTIENLYVDNLRLSHNVNIQKVDVLDWLANAILTNGTFAIPAKKTFEKASFKHGLSLRGKLDGFVFNNESVLLVDVPQNISGKFSFNRNVTFKMLRIKESVNGVDIEKLVQKQIDMTKNMTLKSEVVLNNHIRVKNINVASFQGNLSVPELMSNISKWQNFDVLRDNFQNLLEMGLEAQSALSDKASFFKYYKEIMYFYDNVHEIFGFKCEDGVFRLMVFYSHIEGYFFTTFEWDAYNKLFINSGKHNILLYMKPNFMQQISFGAHDYLYIENLISPYDDANYWSLYSGRLFRLANATNLEIVAEFHVNKTVSLISFTTPGRSQPCLGFIDSTMARVNIYCEETEQLVNSYYWENTISVDGVYMAATTQTEHSVYLFLATQGTQTAEPAIMIYRRGLSSGFLEMQIVFEEAHLNGLVAATIDGIPYMVYSFGGQEGTIDSGWMTIKRFDLESEQFIQWQHIPLTVPLGINLVTDTSFEPLIIVNTADAGAPLQIFRYDGIAGFRRVSTGSSLPVSSKLRPIGKGNFLAAIQEEKSTATLLRALVK